VTVSWVKRDIVTLYADHGSAHTFGDSRGINAGPRGRRGADRECSRPRQIRRADQEPLLIRKKGRRREIIQVEDGAEAERRAGNHDAEFSHRAALPRNALDGSRWRRMLGRSLTEDQPIQHRLWFTPNGLGNTCVTGYRPRRREHMTIDRERLLGIFDGLGQKLARPTTICVIGSSPGIALGQPDRQSLDIDVWQPASTYDETEFRRACRELGILFDPTGELDPDAVYVQIVRPGIVKLPSDFTMEVLGQYGNLKVGMPEPALLSAIKLVRGDPRDIEDVVWWVKQRALDIDSIRSAAHSLPDLSQRETAGENLVLVELIVAGERKST